MATRGPATVLVAVDEPAMVHNVGRILRKRGLSVWEAFTPGEAIRLAESRLDPIDLLIADFDMPEVDRSELCRVLRARDPGLRCLFLSESMPNRHGRHEQPAAKARFIQMPFGLVLLASVVDELLSR